MVPKGYKRSVQTVICCHQQKKAQRQTQEDLTASVLPAECRPPAHTHLAARLMGVRQHKQMNSEREGVQIHKVSQIKEFVNKYHLPFCTISHRSFSPSSTYFILMLLVTKSTTLWRLSSWQKVLIRAPAQKLCIFSLFECWWLGKECLYELRRVQEPSIASFEVKAQWESTECCVPRDCQGGGSNDRTAKIIQRYKDHSRGDVNVNTKKYGGKERRESCPYVIEDTKNKDTEIWRRWGIWGYKQIHHMKKITIQRLLEEREK